MKKILFVLCAICTILIPGSGIAQLTNELGQNTAFPANAAGSLTVSDTNGVWTSRGIGEGFRPDLQEFGVSEGTSWVTRDIGGKKSHNLLLTRLYWGCMLGNRVAEDKWYGGNWEFVQEVFGAWQYYPKHAFLTGATSLVRYNFATGTRWVPFMDGGVGLSLTDIGNPDLGSPGEFNGQIGPGLNYFWNNNLALTLQYRYMHNSNAGIKSPNQGINENIAYIGMSWFF